MVCVAWVFFRAESVGEAVEYLLTALKNQEVTMNLGLKDTIEGIFLLLILVLCEYTMGNSIFPFRSRKVNWSVYLAIILLIILFAQNEADNFIYFQF